MGLNPITAITYLKIKSTPQCNTNDDPVRYHLITQTLVNAHLYNYVSAKQAKNNAYLRICAIGE
jgi:hypothetical protein